jgi:hypothetical protein
MLKATKTMPTILKPFAKRLRDPLCGLLPIKTIAQQDIQAIHRIRTTVRRDK